MVPNGWKPAHLLALILLIAPSAVFLWFHSDMPAFGDIHDDSIYYVSAKSLAEGHYRIENLPEQPNQTKYPPLYPALLSIAWRIQPRFPQNLPIAAWLSWLALPAMLFELMVLYPRMGISGWRMWLILAAIAINPYFILFSATLLSELFFTAFLIAALLLVERAAKEHSAAHWAIAAGIVGGFGYLARSAGIVLLGSGVLYLWWIRRQRVQALRFAAAMIPFVAGWSIWARLHQVHSSELALVYYTDYVKYEVINITLHNWYLVLWKNIDGFIWGLGSFMLPKVTDSLFLKTIAVLMAAAMISGVIRMMRAGWAIHYAIFAAGSAFMLIIWHFPPNERFVLPLLPLGFAGLLREMEHFYAMVRKGFRHPDKSQRVASAILGGTVALALIGCFAMQIGISGWYLDHTAQEQRQKNVDHRAAYQWIRANLPADAAVIAYNDPVLYLNTGHHSISRPLPPSLWYEEDRDGKVELYRELADFARIHNASYLYYTTADLRRDMGYDDTSAIEQVIQANPRLKVVYHQGIGTIYQVQ
jgi:4-amino-4-deoxy-L-arabinose transferase-like glycosyltransferase